MEAGPLGEAPRSHNIQRSDGDEDDDGDDDEDDDDDGESPLVILMMILIGLGHIKFNDWLSSSAFITVRTSSWHLMLQAVVLWQDNNVALVCIGCSKYHFSISHKIKVKALPI